MSLHYQNAVKLGSYKEALCLGRRVNVVSNGDLRTRPEGETDVIQDSVMRFCPSEKKILKTGYITYPHLIYPISFALQNVCMHFIP